VAIPGRAVPLILKAGDNRLNRRAGTDPSLIGISKSHRATVRGMLGYPAGSLSRFDGVQVCTEGFKVIYRIRLLSLVLRNPFSGDDSRIRELFLLHVNPIIMAITAFS
jgi:hypothetical protein